MRPIAWVPSALIVIALLGMTMLPNSYAQPIAKGTAAYLPSIFKIGPTETITATTLPIVPTFDPVDNMPSQTSVIPSPSSSNTPSITSSPSTTRTRTPTMTPPRMPNVVVGSSRGYYSSSFFYVVGEVINTGVGAGYNTKVSAQFYDANNALVAVSEGYTLLTRIEPGEALPFRVLVSNAPPSINRYTLNVASQNSTILDYRPLTIVSQQVRDNFGAEVFGELRNDQTLQVNNIQVAVTFYNVSGDVINVSSGGQLLNLQTGTTGFYKVTTFLTGMTYDHFTVKAEGYTN